MKMRSCVMAFTAVLVLAQAGRAADNLRQRQAESFAASEAAQVKPLAFQSASDESGSAFACAPACEATCEAGCGTVCCCRAPCRFMYGEYLFLRPRNAGLEYAVPMNGPISPGEVPIQEGRTAALNPDFQSGFRVGGGVGFGDCSTIAVGFTHYETTIHDSISTESPHVIRAMVLHPSSADAEADWLDASASEFIRFNVADLEYRHEFYTSENASANYLIGVRYANLDQTFSSQFASTIVENVDAQVKFDGAGLRLGLEGERVGYHNLFVYGKASASFLGGEFRGTYFQGSTTDPLIVDTSWKEARLVSILDCEVGLGWMSDSGRIRTSAGYMVSGWLNVVKQSEFISAVQANDYHGPDKIAGNGLVFDGLVARIELRR